MSIDLNNLNKFFEVLSADDMDAIIKQIESPQKEAPFDISNMLQPQPKPVDLTETDVVDLTENDGYTKEDFQIILEKLNGLISKADRIINRFEVRKK